ncbi:MAG: cytochrome C oxidase subunit IV family protein [Tepidisphaeraceae bacterium]
MTQATHMHGETSTGELPGAPHNPHVPLRSYYLVFAGLMIMLVATVVAAFLPLGGLGIVIALLIATVKAAMVVWIFMHVKFASPLTKIFVISAFLWLGIMFVFTFSDYFTRGWLPMSAGWTESPIRAERYLPPPPATETPGGAPAPSGH